MTVLIPTALPGVYREWFAHDEEYVYVLSHQRLHAPASYRQKAYDTLEEAMGQTYGVTDWTPFEYPNEEDDDNCRRSLGITDGDDYWKIQEVPKGGSFE